MRKRSQPRKITEFFKVLVGDFKERLCLPPAFVHYISNEVSSCALLRAYGREWAVQLLRTNNNVMFGAGWGAFVEYYKLQLGEFLVFQFCTHLQFTAKIFSDSGFERTNQELQACSADSLFSERCKCAPLLRKKSVRVKRSVPMEALNMEEIATTRSSCGDDLSKNDVCKPIRSAADSSKLSNPSFEVVLKKSGYSMPRGPHIPFCIYSTYLKDKKQINLCYGNYRGVKTMWKVKLYARPSRGCDMTAGFAEFCRENNLRPEDECIFELNSDHSAFTVHLTRPKHLPGPQKRKKK